MPIPTRKYLRTRLAPTPSGFLHMGNVASFVFTAGLAREHGALIRLRIDDIDRDRFRMEYLEDVFETLAFLGIPWDEGPRTPEEHLGKYTQALRTDAYAERLEKLWRDGRLFACHCSRARQLRAGMASGCVADCLSKKMPPDTPGVAWRLITETHERIHVRGLDRERGYPRLPDEVHAVVVRRKDGVPAYQLCSVADDIDQEVDLIVRGMDLFPSTLVQHILAGMVAAEGFTAKAFVHHPLLVETAGVKLSKSAGAASIRAMRASGARPQEVFRAISVALGVDAAPPDWPSMYTLLKGVWEAGVLP